MLSLIGYRIFSWLERCSLSHLRSKMHVGKNVEIKKGLRVKSPEKVTIGDYVSIGPDTMMQAHAAITIGEYTQMAGGIMIVTANHYLDKRGIEMRHGIQTPVHIGKNCWLGAGAIILPGVTIGDGAVVGAGSVVSKDLPAEMICVGVPAKAIKARPKP